MKKNDILIYILLDRSGSMEHLQKDVIGYTNQYLESLKALPVEAYVTLDIFDTLHETIYANKWAKEIEPLTKTTYFARGGTALLDAVGKAVRNLDSFKSKPKKVVFVIYTDGEENSSREFSLQQIKDTLTERQNNHDWQVIFVGAGVDAFHGAASIGTRSYYQSTNTSAGVKDFYGNLTLTTANYAADKTATLDLGKTVPEDEVTTNIGPH